MRVSSDAAINHKLRFTFCELSVCHVVPHVLKVRLPLVLLHVPQHAGVRLTPLQGFDQEMLAVCEVHRQVVPNGSTLCGEQSLLFPHFVHPSF